MAKVTEIVFRPLGRKPHIGEWFRHTSSAEGAIYYICRGPNVEGEAVERREVVVILPDPLPTWVERAAKDWRDNHAAQTKSLEAVLYDAFVARVEKAAERAADRINSGTYSKPIIVEEMLKP